MEDAAASAAGIEQLESSGVSFDQALLDIGELLGLEATTSSGEHPEWYRNSFLSVLI